MISEVLGENFENILDEALQKNIIFQSDHELSEGLDVENPNMQVFNVTQLSEVHKNQPEIIILQDILVEKNIDSNNNREPGSIPRGEYLLIIYTY